MNPEHINFGKIDKKVKDEIEKGNVGVDDRLEEDLITHRFINKEQFETEDIKEIQNIIHDFSNRDKKLIKEIHDLNNKSSNNIEEISSNIFEVDFSHLPKEIRGDLSKKDTELFMSFVDKSLSESRSRGELFKKRLYIANSLETVFNKTLSLLGKMKESVEDVTEHDAFISTIKYFEIQKQTAESIRLDVESQLLGIKKMEDLSKSLINKKKIFDQQNNKM